jgi:hypothetical protein
VQIDEVGGAAAVDVGQTEALGVELVGVVEQCGAWSIVTLAPKRAVAKIGPVADFAVADAGKVGQAVAAQRSAR